MEQALYSVLSDLLDCPVSPLFGFKGVPCVTYSIRPISGGYIQEVQAEIKSIAIDYDEALERINKITKALDLKQEQPSIIAENVAFRSSLAGGGELFDPETGNYEITRYYTIKWRYINEP